jgi:hypothetical protein
MQSNGRYPPAGRRCIADSGRFGPPLGAFRHHLQFSAVCCRRRSGEFGGEKRMSLGDSMA